MDRKDHDCPDCAGDVNLDRRHFLRAAGLTAAAAGALPLGALAAPTPESDAEKAVKGLFETLTDEQKQVVCFAWDHQDTSRARRGLLRTHVSNNWQITEPHVKSDFYTKQQQDIIHDIFKSLVNPEWYAKFRKQLKDDTGGADWGAQQSLAIFGTPGGRDKFQFVMTGRHMTIRADGGSTSNMAWGGPIFYGHAAQGFNERADHPGNVFWPQALLANKIYLMLDERRKAKALVEMAPPEARVDFKGVRGSFSGIPVTDLHADERKQLETVLTALVEPYRKEDREEALACLRRQGGLEKCWLTFYKEGDIGDDQVWDNWRLEGPTFVWYFRGAPHVHVWVNVGDNESVKLNSRG